MPHESDMKLTYHQSYICFDDTLNVMKPYNFQNNLNWIKRRGHIFENRMHSFQFFNIQSSIEQIWTNAIISLMSEN